MWTELDVTGVLDLQVSDTRAEDLVVGELGASGGCRGRVLATATTVGGALDFRLEKSEQKSVLKTTCSVEFYCWLIKTYLFVFVQLVVVFVFVIII